MKKESFWYCRPYDSPWYKCPGCLMAVPAVSIVIIVYAWFILAELMGKI